MTKIDTKLIVKLKEATGAPVLRVKKVLEKVEGNEAEAFKILQKEGFERAEKRSARQTSQGKVFAYVHHTGKVASLVELFSETDFVARNVLFETLGKDIVMQIASMGEKDLEKQEFVKDPSKKIADLVKEVIAKTGENVRIGRVFRVVLGEKNG